MRRILVLLVVPVLATGCYTVLRHPQVPSAETSGDWEPVAVRSDCAACHSDWDLAAFEYVFHPGWYPQYGPWPSWYWDPWWVDVVVVPLPHGEPTGSRTQQGAGMANDRIPGTAGPVPTGVWTPPSSAAPSGGVVTVPGAGPRPRAADPPAGQAAPPTEVEAQRGSTPEASGARDSGAATQPVPPPRTPAASPPAERRDAPREAGPTPAPEPRPAERASQPEPRAREAAPATPPASQGTPKPPDTQGRGMTNDRREPKP